MIKNYFINLGKILKDSIVFFAKNFVKNNLLIILLIAVQMLLATPLLYFANKIGYVNFSLMYKIIAPICLVLYFLLFVFMFKKIFKLASVGF